MMHTSAILTLGFHRGKLGGGSSGLGERGSGWLPRYFVGLKNGHYGGGAGSSALMFLTALCRHIHADSGNV